MFAAVQRLELTPGKQRGVSYLQEPTLATTSRDHVRPWRKREENMTKGWGYEDVSQSAPPRWQLEQDKNEGGAGALAQGWSLASVCEEAPGLTRARGRQGIAEETVVGPGSTAV